MSKLIKPLTRTVLRGHERACVPWTLAPLARVAAKLLPWAVVTSVLTAPSLAAEATPTNAPLARAAAASTQDWYHQVQRQMEAEPVEVAPAPRSILERDSLFTPPNLDEIVSSVDEVVPPSQSEQYEARAPQVGHDVVLRRVGTFTIPDPNPNIDYSSDLGRPLHGNGIYSIQALDPDQPYAQFKAEETENPLASPYYNVATGEIDYPEEVLRQKKIDAYVSPEEERATRLKDYDNERVAQLKRLNQYVPFNDLVHHDAVYSYLPETADVFYVDREADRAELEAAINAIEQRSHGSLGFVLLDQNGIVALKDNSLYPLVGISKFHLAYAVASLMSDRRENQDSRIFFYTDWLRSDVYSPLADNLYKKASRIVRDATGQVISDPNSVENRPSRSERSAIIASTVRQYQSGNGMNVDMDEVRLQSTLKKTVEDAQKDLPTKGERVSLSIGDLMYYSLGFSDSNASAILLQYIGSSLKSLELFDRIKGLYRTHFTAYEYDVYKDPRLASANSAPLYESAKLMALYAQDTKIAPEIRKFVNDIMYFNVTGKNAIQRGIREGIYSHNLRAQGKEVPRFSSSTQINNISTPPSLKIYSREGVGGIIEDEGKRTIVSDLALIEYEGRSYVLAVAVKDIRGRLHQSERSGETAIARTARTLFEYVLSRPLYDPNAQAAPEATR